MKHVRERLPDVQRRRPEVSAALAAVLERATDEGAREPLPGRRARCVADLEEALAIEAARAGQLDRRGHRRCSHAARRHRGLRPDRLRRAAAGARARRARAGAAGGAADRVPRTRTEKGTGGTVGDGKPRRASEVRLGRATPRTTTTRAATARSHDDAAPATRSTAIRGTDWDDRDATSGGFAGERQARRRASTWTPASRSRPRGSSITTREARLEAADLRRGRRVRRTTIDGWVRTSSAARPSSARTSASSSTPATQRFRYYLVWITKLPPDERARSELSCRVSAASAQVQRLSAAAQLVRMPALLAWRSSAIAHEPVAELGYGDAAGLPQLRVDAGRR